MAAQNAIAHHLFMSAKRVGELQGMGVMTKGADLDQSREEYITYARKAAATRHGGASGEINDERARLLHHQANLASLDQDVKEGKLIPADEIEKVWSDMILAMRAKLLAMSKKMAATSLGITDYKEMDIVVGNLIKEALDELTPDA